MPNQRTLDLLDAANHAIFEAEQAIRREEKASVNKPMFNMRIRLQAIIRDYCANKPICNGYS